ncbi:hypothetical protein ACIA49_17280 [Kribbella sp. NPDC051587]|uniref:hypothetical protein n=1 Tax=Kribbella sp. NPDC051587 TaxID=3364119 RepID=UPI00379554CA
MAALLLLTACSSNKPAADNQPSGTQLEPATPTTSVATSSAPVATTPVKATAVVAGLTSAGFKCGTDEAYALCTSGAASVSILNGDHPRPPVVSVNANGPVDTASAEIAKVLPKVLEVAHIGQPQEITTWYGEQKGKPTATMTAGDWLINYAAETETEEPGVHLTVTDKLCKSSCQAE